MRESEGITTRVNYTYHTSVRPSPPFRATRHRRPFARSRSPFARSRVDGGGHARAHRSRHLSPRRNARAPPVVADQQQLPRPAARNTVKAPPGRPGARGRRAGRRWYSPPPPPPPRESSSFFPVSRVAGKQKKSITNLNKTRSFRPCGSTIIPRYLLSLFFVSLLFYFVSSYRYCTRMYLAITFSIEYHTY